MSNKVIESDAYSDRYSDAPVGPVVMLADCFPDIVFAHQQAYGHTPWSDRSVAPWECRPCVEKGTKNVF